MACRILSSRQPAHVVITGTLFIIRIDGNIRWREGSHQRAVEPVISLDDRLKTASKKRRDTLQVTASPTSVFRKKTLKTDFITNRRIDYRRAGYLFLVE